MHTCHGELLRGNPYVDIVTPHVMGLLLSYPDPAHAVHPTQHNILSDWQIICREYGLETERPALQPEIYLTLPDRCDHVLVQIHHNRNFHSKRVWPYFSEFCDRYGYTPLEIHRTLTGLVRAVAEARVVVCADSGVQHIARAVGTPAVVVYGGFSQPEWNGYAKHVNITRELKCSPCYNRRLCVANPERACLRDIGLDEVQAAVESLLQ